MLFLKKNSFLFWLLLLLPLHWACDKDSLKAKFDLNYNHVNIMIDTSSRIGLCTLDTIWVRNTLDSVLAANNTSKKKIKSIQLTAIHLEIIEPLGGNFLSLRSAQFYILTPPHAPAKVVAHKDSITPSSSSVLNLDVTPNMELLPYLQESGFNIYMTVDLLKPILQKTQIQANISCQVSLNY